MARRTNTAQSATTASDNEGLADTNQSGAQSSEAGGVIDSAKQTASQAASQAKETASHVLDQAKDQASSRVDQGRQTLASGLGSVAQAFQSMGNRLRNQDEGPIAQYAAEMGQAMGGQVERLANYLQGRSMQELITDVEDLARRSPAVFLGSAFVLGLAASRFLKSSRPAPDFSRSIADPSHLLPPASAPSGGDGSPAGGV